MDPYDYKDLMGYCNPDWVSDYHFKRALDHRRATENFSMTPPADPAQPAKTLLLWGGVGDDEFLLEPAFLVEGRPKLPRSGGPYRIEGLGVDGDTRFSFSFTPDAVEFGGGHFLFAVPHDPERDGALDRVCFPAPKASSPSDGRARAPWRSSPIGRRGRFARSCGTGQVA